MLHSFSQKQIYVQDKIQEQAAFIYDLLEKGAYIYVCGDAKSMAPAVHRTFANIVQTEGILTVNSFYEVTNFFLNH